VNVTGSTKADNYNRIPRADELALTPGAAYVHFTTNNTIEGTEWHSLPDAGAAPLVADASSDILSRPIDVSRYGLIYAGAQKNLGPSGVTLVVIREDLIARSQASLPGDAQLQGAGREQLALQHAQHLRHLHPRLTLKWIKSQGGLAGVGAVNERKASSSTPRSIAPGSTAAPRSRRAAR
jgi:phosphoserine aminotransferase